MPNISKFVECSEAVELLKTGNPFLVCGDEKVLAKLPKGNWIGGTTCYFTINGKSVEDSDKIFITGYSNVAKMDSIKTYAGSHVSKVAKDSPENGFTVLLMPAGCEPSLHYSQFAPTYTGLFLKPIIGWITAMRLQDWEPASTNKLKLPKIFNGQTGEADTNTAIAMHFSLPKNKVAVIKTINPFTAKKDSPVIRFEANNSLVIKDAYINGKQMNFAKYILENKIDYRFPMQANYSGTLINVSFPPQIQGEEILLHQAVFSDIDYHFTEVAEEYKEPGFVKKLINEEKFVCGCSCTLNHLSFNTNGGALCGIDGPLTFGEIAYQLVGNTSVYLELEEI